MFTSSLSPALPVGQTLHRILRRMALTGAALFAASIFAAGGPVDVIVPRDAAAVQYLGGDWRFSYVPSLEAGDLSNFHDPSFDVGAWKTTPVPSHWELHGFAKPRYATPVEGLGLYRRTFQVPANWKDQRVFVRFEGVLHAFECWVNGRSVGTWASGYNPATFDVTDALIAGENTIAVRVSTRAKGFDFDTNDCWGLSGIYRDVKLFAVPATHLSDLTIQTFVEPDKRAEVKIAVALAADASESSTRRVSGVLLDPQGGKAGECIIDLTRTENGEWSGAASVAVSDAQLWTAETPSLYSLQLEVRDGERVVQTHRQRVGIRQITIEDGVLKLNGRPLKLRGVDRHDISPDVGRTMSPEILQQDLALIRQANMNFIRTSHYPSDERLMDLCDEQGVYVMCEVPFGFGDKNLSDPSYQDILLTRARATLQRDKNHPSVIIWSIGNENPITEIGLETGRYVKARDATRPICYPQVGSYFDKAWESIPDFVDIYAPHYPSVARLKHYDETLKRPIIVTEYAHALGLATDRIQDEWEIMEKSKHIAGGALWDFADQVVVATSPTPVDVNAPTLHTWLTSRIYLDTDGYSGADGLVYGDRTPQTDYWETRKVYAPVRIVERVSDITAGQSAVSLTVQNRYTFSDLSKTQLVWLLRRDRELMRSGSMTLSAAPGGEESVAVPVALPRSLGSGSWTLEARLIGSDGVALNERVVRLNHAGAAPAVVKSAKAVPAKVTRDQQGWHISHASFEMFVNAATGAISVNGSHRQPLIIDAGPHMGRRFTMAETLRKKDPIWTDGLMPVTNLESVNVTSQSGATEIAVAATYARAGQPEQSLHGNTTWTVKADGSIAIRYRFEPRNATGEILEAGFALLAPLSVTEFRWLGEGPYAGYPGKDRLNEFGAFHLNRDDLHFNGNRQAVEEAILARADGHGLVVRGAAMNIAVETQATGVRLSHNAQVSGLGNKGVGPEYVVKAAELKSIQGEFTLTVVGGEWAPELMSRHGHPSDSVSVLRPFHHSYDR